MKKAIIIISVLFVALAAWIVAFPDKNPILKAFGKKPATPGAGNQPATQPAYNGISFKPTETAPDTVPGFPLMQGSRGDYVKQFQAALNDNYGSTLAEDGIFGIKTYTAASAHGFNADAITYSDYLRALAGR